MKSTSINRRDFMKGSAVAAGATVLAACVPRTSAPILEQTTVPVEIQPSATLEETISPDTTEKVLNISILYDSVYGNTGKIAQAIQEGLGSQHAVRLMQAGEAAFSDVEQMDFLFIGSPTHGGQFTEPVKNFFENIPAQGLQKFSAAAFDTGFWTEDMGLIAKKFIGLFGYASPQIAEEIVQKGGSVVAAETFFVLETEGPLKDGEVERAKEWAKGVIKTLTAA